MCRDLNFMSRIVSWTYCWKVLIMRKWCRILQNILQLFTDWAIVYQIQINLYLWLQHIPQYWTFFVIVFWDGILTHFVRWLHKWRQTQLSTNRTKREIAIKSRKVFLCEKYTTEQRQNNISLTTEFCYFFAFMFFSCVKRIAMFKCISIGNDILIIKDNRQPQLSAIFTKANWWKSMTFLALPLSALTHQFALEMIQCGLWSICYFHLPMFFCDFTEKIQRKLCIYHNFYFKILTLMLIC